MLLLLLGVFGGCGGGEEESSTAAPKPLSPKAGAFLQRAQQAYTQKEYRAALIMADSAARYAPNQPDVHFTRGRALTELKRPEAAQAAYERALSLEPGYQGARFNLANNAFRGQRYRDALDLYRKVLQTVEAEPDKAHFYHGTGGRGERSAVLLQMGRAYEQLGVIDSARIAFQEAVSSNDSSATAYGELADLYSDQGETQKGLEQARMALQRAPEEPNYQYQVGRLLVQSGSHREAIPYLRRAAEEMPWHQGAHYNLGQALLQIGERAEAERYLTVADSLRAQEQRIDQLREAAEINPRNLRAWLQLGSALRRSGRYGEAMDAFEYARSMAPGSVALLNNLANLALLEGDTLGAIQRYQAILRRDSTSADVWFNLGVVYAQSNRMDAARQNWKKALQFDPDHAQAKRYLARTGE